MALLTRNAGVWQLRSLMLRRFFDLQYATVEHCLRRGIGMMPDFPMRVLDFGAGFAPYHGLFAPRFTMETLDAHVPAMYRGWNDIPADAKYDLVLAIETLEHLEHPADFLRETRARLKPSGELWVTVPYSVRVHPCPDDWHRWTPQGFEKLFREAGFELVEFTMRGPSPLNLFAKLAWANFRLLKDVFAFPLGILMLPLTCVLLLLAHLVCAKERPQDDDPLGYFVRARLP